MAKHCAQMKSETNKKKYFTRLIIHSSFKKAKGRSRISFFFPKETFKPTAKFNTDLPAIWTTRSGAKHPWRSN